MSTSSDPDTPGLRGLLNGEGEPHMRGIAWTGTIILGALLGAEVLHLLGA